MYASSDVGVLIAGSRWGCSCNNLVESQDDASPKRETENESRALPHHRDAAVGAVWTCVARMPIDIEP
jgi:hypothetical protein